MDLPADFLDPPRDCSLAPFWFWNDDLDADEVRRQIDDFHDHGVYGFVIHPRVGLPRSLSFMSDPLLQFMRIAVEHAASRDMWVILYDEGMYPSGAAGGLVVEQNPRFACRGLVRKVRDADAPVQLDTDENLVTDLPLGDGRRCVVVDRPVDSWIRGLHYDDHDGPRHPDGAAVYEGSRPPGPPPVAESRPPAADLLNPEAVAAFIRIVYDGYRDAVGEHFGKTIKAIFTDEPMLLGRGDPYDARPGTTGILQHVNDYLGYDFEPHLPNLWDDSPQAMRYIADWHRAVKHRLEQTYYQPLHDWCQRHDLALTGHPAEPDDIGMERWFHWPGQDIVWRDIEPGEKAVTGHQSTQAKVAASAKAHHHRPRNANEYMGAYGHDVTLAKTKWVSDWLLARGCDLLIPHAFFYSTRGPRIDECPPQLGPSGRFWDNFKPYADYCRRLCWLNAAGRPVVKTAILTLSDYAPTRAMRVLHENQIDFHFMEARQLAEQAIIANDGIDLAGFWYRAVILDGIGLPRAAREPLARLSGFGCVIVWQPPEGMPLPPNAIVCHEPGQLVEVLTEKNCLDVRCSPTPPGLRVRHVELPEQSGSGGGEHWFMLFNEAADPVDTLLKLPIPGRRFAVDPVSGDQQPLGEQVRCLLPAFELGLLRVVPLNGQ